MRTSRTGSTPGALRRARGRACLSAVAALSCAALVVPVASASADPSPSPSPTSSSPTPSSAPTTAPTDVLPAPVTDGQIANAQKEADAKAAQVRAIQADYAVAAAKLQAVQNAAEVAAETYNAAELLLQQRSSAAASADTRAAAAVAAAKRAQDQVGELAVHSYIDGGSLGDLAPFLVQGGPQELLDKASMLGTLSDIRSQGLQRAQAASAVAGVLQRQAAIAKAQQLAAVQAAKTAKDSAQKAADAATTETSTLKARQDAMLVELASLQQTTLELQQKQQAALLAKSNAQVAAAAQAQFGPTPTTVSATPTTKAATAIAYAKAQLGKWYLWGGAGPDRFDCSGLTMRAWQQAGVSLGHYTGWQYAHTAHVSIADRQPGDLIFYGPTVAGIHHVGLYLGNDMMIEAPHTGAQVRYANIWRSDIILTVGRP